MARPLEQLRRELQELSVSDKETLLRVLWEELDGPPASDVDAAWAAESRRRDLEVDSGAVETISADEVFRTLESALKK